MKILISVVALLPILVFGLFLTATAQEGLDELKQRTHSNDPQAHYELAQFYSKRGRHAEALPAYEAAATRGHLEAKFRVAEAFLEGRGIPPDEAKARKACDDAIGLAKICAATNNVAAMFLLGEAFYLGKVIQRNKSEAYFWLTLAANNGNQAARTLLKSVSRAMTQSELQKALQETERRVVSDLANRIRALETAAANNDTASQYALAMTNLVRRDLQQAFQLFEKAAGAGHVESKVMLGEICLLRDQKEESRARALKLFTEAAEANSSEAAFFLFYCYHLGVGCERNKEKAMECLTSSAERGYAGAEYTLGELFYTGKQEEKDFQRSFSWFSKAARQGHASAQYSLAQSYFFGRGTLAQPATAAHWFLQAAQQGDRDAQRELAVMYAKGLGLRLDEAESYKWLLLAAKDGNASATEYKRITERLSDPRYLAAGKTRSGFVQEIRSPATERYERIKALFLTLPGIQVPND